MANTIEIKKQDDKLIWLEANNAPYNTDVTITEGCQAIVLCDGAFFDNFNAGTKKINIKSFLGKGDGKNWSVYGVNSSERFELPFGGQIKYNDKEFDIIVNLRLAGVVIARIENGKKLFRNLSCPQGEGITKTVLANEFRGKLIDVAETCVSEMARSGGETGAIAIKDIIAKGIQKSLEDALRNEYGLNIIDVRVRINEYEGLEELWALKHEAAKSKIQADIARSTGEGLKSIGDGITAFTPAPPAPAAPAEINKSGDKIELIIKTTEDK